LKQESILSGNTGSASIKDLPKPKDMEKVAGKCPYAVIHMDGVAVNCLVDSGSEVTTITKSYYVKHFKDTPIYNCKWIHLSASNGLSIPIEGIIVVDITTKNQIFNNMYVLVTQDSINPDMQNHRAVAPGILGCNVIQYLYRQHLEGTLDLTITEDTTLFQQQLEQYINKAQEFQTLQEQLIHNDTGTLGFVKTLGSHVYIPANTSTTIRGTTRRLPETLTVIVEHIESTPYPDLMITPTLTHIDHNGHIAFEITNLGQQDIIIERASRIAKISLCQLIIPDIDEPLQYRQTAQTIDDFPFKINMGNINLDTNNNDDLIRLFNKYQNVFSQDDNDIGSTDLVKHRIITQDDIPIKEPDRRIPPNLKSEVKKILQNWLDAGIIKHSDSPYASQIVLVHKKSGDVRICIDYRALNIKTIKDAFPLPKIEECLESLSGAKYFCSLDLTQGYMQVKIDDNDAHKTAFRALGSLYEYTRLPFGLCNSPATFSRLMHRCFGDDFQEGMIFYLDDILLYSRTIPEMIQRLDLVFKKLQHHGLKVKPQKCHFFKEKVSFLGHTISAKGIQTDPEKIQAVQNFDRPSSDKTLRQFLGLTSYFRRFIKNFAIIASPLHNLLQGKKKKKQKKVVTDGKWPDKWTEECETAFKMLKSKLINTPILQYPDFNKSFYVETYASMIGFGAVLYQMEGKQKQVIAYASRKMKLQEQTIKGYSSMKIEFLAMHWAITKKFKDYLYGAKHQFIVRTDNHPLSRMLSTKQTAADMGKIADLADYNFQLEYKSGRTNLAADALSRNPITTVLEDNIQDQITAYICDYDDNTLIPDELKIQIEPDLLHRPEIFTSINEIHISANQNYHDTDLKQLQQQDSYISRVLDFMKKTEEMLNTLETAETHKRFTLQNHC